MSKKLKFKVGDTAWCIVRNEKRDWAIAECVVYEIHPKAAFCYFVEVENEKREYTADELYSEKEKAEFVLQVLETNYGGVRLITLEEMLELSKEIGHPRLCLDWMSSKVGVHTALRLWDEYKKLVTLMLKGGAE